MTRRFLDFDIAFFLLLLLLLLLGLMLLRMVTDGRDIDHRFQKLRGRLTKSRNRRKKRGTNKMRGRKIVGKRSSESIHISEGRSGKEVDSRVRVEEAECMRS